MSVATNDKEKQVRRTGMVFKGAVFKTCSCHVQCCDVSRCSRAPQFLLNLCLQTNSLPLARNRR
jgi:hypothetical protein